MSNFSITAPLVDGSLMPFIDEGESCREGVLFLCGDDLRPPPRSVRISVKTESGKLVEITIPNDQDSSARVTIDGNPV